VPNQLSSYHGVRCNAGIGMLRVCGKRFACSRTRGEVKLFCLSLVFHNE
jgi:hypothetical protein